jgi:hypothetical protein
VFCPVDRTGSLVFVPLAVNPLFLDNHQADGAVSSNTPNLPWEGELLTIAAAEGIKRQLSGCDPWTLLARLDQRQASSAASDQEAAATTAGGAQPAPSALAAAAALEDRSNAALATAAVAGDAGMSRLPYKVREQVEAAVITALGARIRPLLALVAAERAALEAHAVEIEARECSVAARERWLQQRELQLAAGGDGSPCSTGLVLIGAYDDELSADSISTLGSDCIGRDGSASYVAAETGEGDAAECEDRADSLAGEAQNRLGHADVASAGSNMHSSGGYNHILRRTVPASRIWRRASVGALGPARAASSMAERRASVGSTCSTSSGTSCGSRRGLRAVMSLQELLTPSKPLGILKRSLSARETQQRAAGGSVGVGAQQAAGYPLTGANRTLSLRRSRVSWR